MSHSLGLTREELNMSTLTRPIDLFLLLSIFFRSFSCSFFHHHDNHRSVCHNSHHHHAVSHFCFYHSPPDHHQTSLHQPQDHHSSTSHHHSIPGPHSLTEEQTGGPRQQAVRLSALPSRRNLRGRGQWLHLHLSRRKRRSCVRERWEVQKIEKKMYIAKTTEWLRRKKNHIGQKSHKPKEKKKCIFSIIKQKLILGPFIICIMLFLWKLNTFFL